MDMQTAGKLGACLAKDYAEDLFRLLVNYRDISASEAASRLDIHIRTAQDCLETLTDLGILSREEVHERKRPYFRYSLQTQTIRIEIDLDSLYRHSTAGGELEWAIRERKGGGVHFSTARNGKQITSLTVRIGSGRDRKERKISLTTPQGLFLYHLPFPTAEPLSVREIMDKAGVSAEHKGEIVDLVDVLREYRVIEQSPDQEASIPIRRPG